MTISDQKKAISLFFYYAFLDERLALQVTDQTIKQGQKVSSKLNQKDVGEELSNSSIVYLTHKAWLKVKNKKKISFTTNVEKMGWILPKGVALGLWRHFVREAEPEELLTLIWSLLLKIDEKDIAKGLGVTVGTVQYRASHGLKRLSSMMTIGS